MTECEDAGVIRCTLIDYRLKKENDESEINFQGYLSGGKSQGHTKALGRRRRSFVGLTTAVVVPQK